MSLSAQTYLQVPERKFLEIKGPDAARFLNGQITNDINSCTLDRSLPTYICNAKGKILAEACIHLLQTEHYLIDYPSCLLDTLPHRLEKYLIADQVELQHSPDWTLFHFLKDPQLKNFHPKLHQRLGTQGWDLIVPNDQAPNLHQSLMFSHWSSLSQPETEIIRITNGKPKWGSEISEERFPQELEPFAFLSYHKGCYVGQEILSRIKFSGKMPKFCVRVHSAHPFVVGDALLNPEKSAAVGIITSATVSNHSFIGIAIVQYKENKSPLWHSTNGTPIYNS